MSKDYKNVYANGTMDTEDVLMYILKKDPVITFGDIFRYSIELSKEYPLLKYDLSRDSVTTIVLRNPKKFIFVGENAISLNKGLGV